MKKVAPGVSTVARTGVILLGCMAAAAPAVGRAGEPLAMPAAQQIPADLLRPAIEEAVANGVASLIARITAEGNTFGLAYPPRISRKQIGMKSVPARRVVVPVNVYEREYATVDQMVPEISGGLPTGRFVRAKVKVVTKVTKVGTRDDERLVYDPEGSYSMQMPEYAPGGPDIYEPGQPGYNGMALYALAKSGHARDFPAEQLATAMADLIGKIGMPDSTFDVAWMAAGFCALGPDSPHAALAGRLVSKLLDGQIREPGEARGLWGPVCINYRYFARLFDMEQAVRQELEVKLPRIHAAAPPQQQALLAKQGQELGRVLREVVLASRSAAALGMRLADVKRPSGNEDQGMIPGLPLFIYNRIVADVESTAAAAFALAEARRAGLLPAETERPKIRGKRVHPAEKTEPAVALALDRLVAAVRPDGGFTSLTFQAVNTGFDKSSLAVAGVPFTGQHPPLLQLETATTDASGQSALEFLALVAPKAAEDCAESRDRARARSVAVAERWYRQSAGGLARGWPDVYATLTVPLAHFKESRQAPQPKLDPLPVDELPWGGSAAACELMPALTGLFATTPAADILADDLFRQLAYRLVCLQGDDGQWKSRVDYPPSSGFAALAIEEVAARYHRVLTEGPEQKLPDPVPYRALLRPTCTVGSDVVFDGGGYATLASLVFLLQAVETPVDLAGVAVLPEAGAGDAAAAGPLMSVAAAGAVKRPNAARATLYDAILAAQSNTPAVPPPPAAPAASRPTREPVIEEPAEELGTVDDILAPAK